MKTLVISYSHTGNNDALATSLTEALGAEHVRVTEHGRRAMGTIVMDMMLKRTPRITMPAVDAKGYDLVLFTAPVWLGQPASPLRSCFKELASDIGDYAFVSISGGADGANPKLGDELTKQLGRPPTAVVDLAIADLLPAEPAPTRDATMNYRVSPAEIAQLTEVAVARLKKAVPNVAG